MAFVLDASVALGWCFIDERSKISQDLLTNLKHQSEVAVVPEIWPLEIANILVGAERNKRISYAEMVQYFELLEGLAVEIDKETSLKAFHEIASLSYSEKITTYDASYLELALRKDIPLATNDNALKKAAQRLGVRMLGNMHN